MGGSLVGDGLEGSPSEVAVNLALNWGQLIEAKACEVTIVHELMKAWILRDREAAWEAADFALAEVKFAGVEFNLIAEGVVANSLASIDDLLKQNSDLLGVVIEAEHEVAGDGGLLVLKEVLLIELRDFVHVAELSDGTKEVVGRDGSLALEEREPEDLSVLCG